MRRVRPGVGLPPRVPVPSPLRPGTPAVAGVPSLLVHGSRAYLPRRSTTLRPRTSAAMQRRRLAADRFRRVWAIVEYVAGHPGCSRRVLADQFAIAERTLQADLNTIRYDMGLPLTRSGGYRFAQAAPGAAGQFGLADACVLARALEQAAGGRASAAAVRAVAAKLPEMFPVHLRPLVRYGPAVAAGR